LISAVKNVYIVKGKKIIRMEPFPENQSDILKSAMGRSGNLRAPTLKTREAVYIGFNDLIYQSLLD
jgi:hypothetical protein